MAAKIVSLSDDDITYHTVPGMQGDLTVNGAMQDDTIFGQNFKSELPGILDWSLSANAIFKGISGYQGKLKSIGATTGMTAEPMTLVSGKTYQITATAKRFIDRSVAVVVYDGAVDHTADVESIDILFGRVTFLAAYTPTGAITLDGSYFPTAQLGAIKGFTLNQSCALIDETDYDGAQANGGFKINSPGLLDISLTTNGIFKPAYNFFTQIAARTELLIEISPDGAEWTGSMARGVFKLGSQKVSGNVGALEQEDLDWKLSVPLQATGPAIERPFAWAHAGTSVIPVAVQIALDSMGLSTVFMRYWPDGATGRAGSGIMSSVSLASTVDGINTFSLALAGSEDLV